MKALATADVPADVAVADGRYVLVIDAASAGAIAALLEQALSARYRLGRPPVPVAHDVLRAARAAHALSMFAVPAPEPLLFNGSSDAGVWISTKEAAGILHLGERAVTKRITAGTLAARKVSGRWLVRLEARTAVCRS